MGDACAKEDCVGCPVMFKDSVSFCARCDGPPENDSSRRSQNPQIEASTPSVISPRSSVSSLSTISDASTPASELITAIPPAPVLPIADPAAEARRRQSDAASAAIGARLLKGWILLAQECVNPSCQGIPLMKRPKPRPANPGQELEEVKKNRKFASSSTPSTTPVLPDPRKFCVNCERNYVDERDQAALAAWEAANAPPQPVAEPKAQLPGPSTSAAGSSKGKKRELEDSASPVRMKPASKSRVTSTQSASATGSAIQALQTAGDRLVEHLNALSSAAVINVNEIGNTAEALGKVHRAMKDVQ